jgi:replicative DNA helicase
MSPPLWEKLMQMYARVQGWPLYVEPAAGMNPVQIAARMRRLYREVGVRRFFVDHLGEMVLDESDERLDRKIGAAFKVFRDTLVELRAGGVMYHQLGRVAEKGGSPSLSWLLNSDEVGQVARVAIFLDRKEGERKVSLHFAKATYGPPGVSVELGWDPSTMSVFQPEAP